MTRAMINLQINGNTYKNIDLIIFDKDGTLFKLYPYCSKMVFERTKAICNELEKHDKTLQDWLILIMGVDLENHRIFPEGPIGVYSKYYAQDMLFEKMNSKGYNISKKELKNAFETADKNINRIEYLKDALVPVPGMIKFIEDISDKCNCAIYSNDMTKRLNDTLKLFGIEKNFNSILGSDLVEKHKPDPMGVNMILEELKIPPEKTAFIGDSVLDIECGKRAKCKYLLSVLSDISDLKFLKSNSNELIKDFTNIKVI